MQAIELWRTGELKKLDSFIRAMVFGFLVSYLAYFIMPAIGPRFTLHDFSKLNEELPGLALTPAIRAVIDVGGGVTRGAISPELLVNRDCMPSGHTMITLTNIILAFRFRSRMRWLFVVIGGSLIFSTVYLRYHYVIDLVVGAVLAVVVLALEPVVNQWLKGKRDEIRKVWKTILTSS